jgi:3-keto-L-gulonate-6-phosphate decarboxylase
MREGAVIGDGLLEGEQLITCHSQAGGVKLSTIGQYTALNPGIIIAGGALYNAPDIRAAVIAMKEAMRA